MQLFGLVMEVRSNPGLRAEIIKELFETKGALVRRQDWNSYLQRV
jgi:hypothetical protein